MPVKLFFLFTYSKLVVELALGGPAQLVKLPLVFLVSTMVGTPLNSADEDAASVGTEQARRATNTAGTEVEMRSSSRSVDSAALLTLAELLLSCSFFGVVRLTSTSLLEEEKEAIMPRRKRKGENKFAASRDTRAR